MINVTKTYLPDINKYKKYVDKIYASNYLTNYGPLVQELGASLNIGSFTAISQGCRVINSTDDFKNWGFGNSTIDDGLEIILQHLFRLVNFVLWVPIVLCFLVFQLVME